MDALQTFAAGVNPDALPLPDGQTARLRLATGDDDRLDLLLRRGRAARTAAPKGRADASLRADAATWRLLARRDGSGLQAFQAGRLRIRGNLHLAVALLAAGGPLRFDDVASAAGPLSSVEAGEGPAVLLLHGLGATKLSMLPTLAALAEGGRRAIALDLPGFGDSAKPLRAAYDPAWFARTLVTALDALEIDRADVVGNSLGGRVALELALGHPERTGRLGLLCPSLAWRRRPRWIAPLKLVRPELGLLQPAPRAVVDPIVRRFIPGARDGWAAVGVDEFLRGYVTPRGRAAFYAAARNIVLENPDDFWTRLARLEHRALFVWGRDDTVVPPSFARHVAEVLPSAEHLELPCGHVPQLERPRDTHRALERLLTT